MCLQRHQVNEVGEYEEGEDQVHFRAAHECHDEADHAHDQRRPEPLPEAIDEGDQRDVVVFEAEPPLAREPLHPEGLVPGLMSVDEDERARGEERGNRECD